jgi:hypothetical protein
MTTIVPVVIAPTYSSIALAKHSVRPTHIYKITSVIPACTHANPASRQLAVSPVSQMRSIRPFSRTLSASPHVPQILLLMFSHSLVEIASIHVKTAFQNRYASPALQDTWMYSREHAQYVRI